MKDLIFSMLQDICYISIALFPAALSWSLFVFLTHKTNGYGLMMFVVIWALYFKYFVFKITIEKYKKGEMK